MIAWIVLAAIVLFGSAYIYYGRFLARRVGIEDTRPTPAVAVNDGVDYVPARPSLLLGQHFSAIAAAGPIVGPIIAGIAFGWLPALLWVIFGAIFIGGVHDFMALVASVRHGGASIGEIVKRNMSRRAHVLFLLFVWLALVYVIIAFTDITAQTFRSDAISKTFADLTGSDRFGPGVAAASLLYLLAGVAMGLCLYKLKMSVTRATIIFLPIVLLIVWAGPRLPAGLLDAIGSLSTKQFDVILLVYCFIASIIPVWVLLQPRGYLGGWMLYLVIAAGLLGALSGRFGVQFPAVTEKAIANPAGMGMMLPFLFITVACGACSGFHAIVSSGTTSKQLARESHARPIGYGAMLLEGIVAVLALATVMMLPAGTGLLKADPNIVYASGIATYLDRLFRLPLTIGLPFALLAFSTFVYDTLDVCTRLARYILQELTGLKSRFGAVLATLITLAVPLAFLLSSPENAWKNSWTVFGASNQLLASLTLLVISVWLIARGRSAIYTLVPMALMMGITLWALVLLAMNYISAGWKGGAYDVLNFAVVIVLLGLSVVLLAEAAGTLSRKVRQLPPQRQPAA